MAETTPTPTRTKPVGKIVKHAYLKAMSKIAEAMDELTTEDQERVVAWYDREYIARPATEGGGG